jgi:hypothetical protein
MLAEPDQSLGLPLRPAEITAAWLTEALRARHPGVTVTRAEIRDVISGTSTKFRVAVEYAPEGGAASLPSSLIVKGGFEDHSPWMAGMYADEVKFYRDIRPHIAMNTPACYFAGSDPSSHQSIVILEDLKLRDVTFQNPLVPSTYEQLARRLDAMALYHAQTWNSGEFAAGGRLAHITTRYQGYGKYFHERYLEPERWAHFMRSPRGAAVSVRLHDRDWMRGALDKLEQYHKQFPPCIIHGDTHLGNLYLEKDGTPGFLDAQICRAPWQMEVNYHLIVACDIADRRLWEPALIARYLEALKRHGVDAPCFEAAWEAYRRETAYGYFIFVINENFFQTESVNTAEAARFGAAALDHGTIGLLS